MEYRDLYDENKNLTGEKININDEIPKGKYINNVVIFIENDRGELLLQINKKYNLWSTTGGHPKSGESSIDGIITEVKEELGIDISNDKLILFKTIKTEDDFVDLYYLKKDIDLMDIDRNEEVGEVGWFDEDEILEMISKKKLIPSHVTFYKELLKYKGL